MNYWNKICGIGIFLFLVSYNITAQTRPTQDFRPSKVLKFDVLKERSNMNLRSDQVSFTKLLPANFYTQNFGFFCKKELAVEKYLKVPLRVRLGSVQQCDYLEGKQVTAKHQP